MADQKLDLIVNRPQRVRIVFADEMTTDYGNRLRLKVVADGVSKGQDDLRTVWANPALGSTLIEAGATVQSNKWGGRTYKLNQQTWWVIEKAKLAGDKYEHIEMRLEDETFEPSSDDPEVDAVEADAPPAPTKSEAGPGMPKKTYKEVVAPRLAASKAAQPAAPVGDDQIVELYKDTAQIILDMGHWEPGTEAFTAAIATLMIGRQKIR